MLSFFSSYIDPLCYPATGNDELNVKCKGMYIRISRYSLTLILDTSYSYLAS